MTRRLIAAVVPILLLAAGLGFQRYWQAARDDIQQARLAQCAVAYELVLRQLLERADLPGGQASAPLLTQLQILESQPCGERRLADTLTPGGGVGHLLPLARAANTPEGLSVFVAALYPLLQTVGERATAGASPQNRVGRVQSRYREAMPMFGRLEQGASTADRMALQKHLESVRRDFAAGADSDRFERARVAYNESLQKLALALDRSAPGVAVAVSRARSGLSRLYDEAIVGQNAALQTRIETRQLDQKLAVVALFILAAILLVAGLLTAAAIERDRRRRLQGLVQVSRRTAQGELGLVVDARRGGGKVSELEQAFNEMTADLSRRYQKIIDELKVALDSAKAAERAKSDFLHNVSHEIRTPMNAILGMSHLALQTPLDRRQKDYIGTIHKEAKSLIALVNDILDFSSIAAGKMSAESIEFDLQDVLDPLLADTRGKAVAKGLRFEADIAPSVPMALVGDPQRLGQILAHYASNALKFTERGLIRFELAMVAGAAQADAAPVGLRFAFTDTGIGISDEQKADLFQSIRQGDGSATRKHGGPGWVWCSAANWPRCWAARWVWRAWQGRVRRSGCNSTLAAPGLWSPASLSSRQRSSHRPGRPQHRSPSPAGSCRPLMPHCSIPCRARSTATTRRPARPWGSCAMRWVIPRPRCCCRSMTVSTALPSRRPRRCYRRCAPRSGRDDHAGACRKSPWLRRPAAKLRAECQVCP